MHGKVWMFSNLIDDEDIEFMQHEFISYKQAMDYYELGYKPIVRLSHKAGAVYKVGKKVLIKRSTFEKYLKIREERKKNGKGNFSSKPERRSCKKYNDLKSWGRYWQEKERKYY